MNRKIFMVYWLVLVILCFARLDLYSDLPYYDYAVSDWLIDWEGGFVRRGLGGQLLYWAYQLHPFDVILVIKRITSVCSVLFLLLLFRVFSKEGWSLSILPLSCCLYFTIFHAWQRRDLLMLIMIYYFFVSYRNLLRRRTVARHFLFIALSVVMILFHESAFFMSVPIAMVYGWIYMFRDRRRRTASKYTKWLLPFIPVFFALGAVVMSKGNASIASAIWHSWYPTFNAYPDGCESFAQTCVRIGDGVDALSWDAGTTFQFHLFSNFVGDYGVQHHAPWEYLTVLVWLWMLAAVYYLTTHINTIGISFYPLTQRPQSRRISNVMLVQLIFVLPFFTCLSIDWGRTLPYWVFSALFALHVFGDLELPAVSRLSERIQTRLGQGFWATPLCFLLVALLLPIVKTGTPQLKAILNLGLHL